MIEIALRRRLSEIIAHLVVGQSEVQCTDQGLQDKSADHGRAHVVGCFRHFRHWSHLACWRSPQKPQRIQFSDRQRTRLKVA
jgi:hypothetical protein